VTTRHGADTAPDTPGTDGTNAGERAVEAAAVFAQLRPYLPTRYLAAALCSGSAALTRRGWEWVIASGGRTARSRLAGLSLGVYVAGYEALHGQTWILPVVCGAWVCGAWAHSPATPATPAGTVDEGQDDELPDEGGEDDGQEETAPPGGAPPVDVDLVICLAYELAAADDSANSRAMQLDHLLTHLPAVSKPALVAALADAGVPVRDVKYRLAGGRQQVRQGVRLEHLPTGAGEAPPPPAAGSRTVPVPAGAGGAADPSPPPAPAPAPGAG
jgi:hypothetical protein